MAMKTQENALVLLFISKSKVLQCYKTNSNKNTEFAAVKKGAKLETF